LLILPISHEKLSVQRLPWITIGIIVINILVYMGTWYIVGREQEGIETQTRKVAQYYAQHPYLKLSDYFVQQLPKYLRDLLNKYQLEAAKKKEEADQKLAALRERGEQQISKIQEERAKYLLSLKEKRLAARSIQERDAIDKQIEQAEKQIEKYKGIEEKVGSLKIFTSVEEEQAELDRLTQELKRVAQSTFFYQYGLVPSNIQWYAFLTSIFLHGGLMHLLGNMFFLWLCGCNIEDLWGRIVYPIFYLIGGLAGTLGHVLVSPNATQPLIGASGAIAAVMGAFMVRLYDTRIKFFYFFWIFFVIRWGTFLAPAWIMLLLWLLENLAFGLVSSHFGGGGIAYWAHVGGFIFGAIVAATLKLTGVEEKYLAPAIEKKIGVFKQHPKMVSGIEKLDKGRVDAALMDFKAALRDDPQDVDARHQLAEAYKRKNQPDLAQQEMKNLMALYLRKNQSDLAAQTYLELKGLNPPWLPDTKDAFPIAQALEKQEFFAQALEVYYALYKNNPAGPLAVRSLIKCGNLLNEKMGQPQQACQALETAKNLAGNDPIWSKQIEEGLAKAKASLILPTTTAIEVSGVAPISLSPAAESSPPVYYRGASPDMEIGKPMAEEVAARARQIQAHRVKVTALSPQGLQVVTKDGRQGSFPWEKVKGLFVGKVLPPPPQKGVFLFLDVIMGKAETPQVLEVRTMRINGAELSYKDIIEDPQPQGIVNFKKFTAKVLNLCPQAAALPAPQNVLGNPFRDYQTPEDYEADLGLWVERRL
jgi:membrane associated rhomboid family serine protease